MTQSNLSTRLAIMHEQLQGLVLAKAYANDPTLNDAEELSSLAHTLKTAGFDAAALETDNARLRALLAAARDTIAEWAVAHVWREDDGEKPAPQHEKFMAEIAAALGE